MLSSAVIGKTMKIADCEILILPGYAGSEDEHWQARWADRLFDRSDRRSGKTGITPTPRLGARGSSRP